MSDHIADASKMVPTPHEALEAVDHLSIDLLHIQATGEGRDFIKRVRVLLASHSAQAARIAELEDRVTNRDAKLVVQQSTYRLALAGVRSERDAALARAEKAEARVKELEAERDSANESAMCNASNAVEIDKIGQLLGLDDFDDQEVTRAMDVLNARCEALEEALKRMVAIGYTHEEGCWPSEDQHTDGCREKRAALEQAKAALRALEG